MSEPVSDYTRWEYAINYGNVEAGEELRLLPRHLAYDLLHPVADFFVYEQFWWVGLSLSELKQFW